MSAFIQYSKLLNFQSWAWIFTWIFTSFIKKRFAMAEGIATSLLCSLCDEVCKRGAQMKCCGTRACRSCAVLKINKIKKCWNEECGQEVISPENHLKNDNLLRKAVEQFLKNGNMNPDHEKMPKRTLADKKTSSKLLHCDKCDVWVQNSIQLQIHKWGKNHMKKSKMVVRHFCNICLIEVSCNYTLEIHKLGKTHKKRMGRSMQIKEATANSRDAAMRGGRGCKRKRVKKTRKPRTSREDRFRSPRRFPEEGSSRDRRRRDAGNSSSGKRRRDEDYDRDSSERETKRSRREVRKDVCAD